MAESQAIKRARLAEIVSQSSLTVFVNLLIAMFSAYVLLKGMRVAPIAAWLCLQAAVTIMRLVTIRRHAAGPQDGVPSAFVLVLGPLISGSLWGGASVAFSFSSIEFRLFFASVIGGMCAGTTAVNSAYFPAVAAFILPATLPLSISFALHGTRADTTSAFMICVFSISLCLSSLRAHQAFGKRIALQIEVEAHKRDLLSAHAGLQREMLERKNIEEKLHQAQKMEALGQLAGGIAHDFNNILQAVRSGASLMEQRASTPDIKRTASMINDAAERGASVTRRLLAFARKDELHAEDFDIGAVLFDLREIIFSAIGPAIEVVLEVARDLPPVRADRRQFETVVINLAFNARDAMPDGGHLTLRAELDPAPAGLAGRFIRLTIADTGCGMDADILARAGEPFFTTKPTGKGTGLGLSMSSGFAEQSGGAFAITSTVGAGTCVNLWLPTGQSHAAAETEGDAGDRAGNQPGGADILLVDDDPIVREMLAGLLMERGFRVSVAETAMAALALLCDTSQRFDLLVTDFSMPGMNGVRLIQQAQSQLPGLPAILLTGYAGEAADLPQGQGAAESFIVLRKPVSSEELVTRIFACLAKRAAGYDREPAAAEISRS